MAAAQAMRGGLRTTAKETHSGPDHLQLVEQTDLRADHHADQELILTGELQPGQKLPSIRALANGCASSAITTKRALYGSGGQGFIETVQGKGSFVTGGNVELLREERRRQIEQRLMRLVDDARSADIGDDELREMMDLIMEGDAS